MPGFKSVFVSALTEVTTTIKDQLGDLRFVGNKIYKYVKHMHTGATVTGAVGDVAVYFAAVGYTQNRVVVDYADGDTVPLGAGVKVGTHWNVGDEVKYEATENHYIEAAKKEGMT